MNKYSKNKTKELKPQKHFRSSICTYIYWSGRESKLCMSIFFWKWIAWRNMNRGLNYFATDKCGNVLAFVVVGTPNQKTKRVYTLLVCQRTNVVSNWRTYKMSPSTCLPFVFNLLAVHAPVHNRSLLEHTIFVLALICTTQWEWEPVCELCVKLEVFFFWLKHQTRLMICFADRRWSQYFVAIELLTLVCIKNVLSLFEKCHNRRAQ